MQSPAVCSACGNPLFPDAKFCATCGAPLEAYNEPTTQPEAQRSAPSVCIVCGNELSRRNRSLRRDVCLKCFAGGVWQKFKPPNEWAVAQIQNTLEQGEAVVATVSGWHSYEPSKGLQSLSNLVSEVAVKVPVRVPFLVGAGYLIATTTRILYYIKKATVDEVRSYPLSTISSVYITKKWINKGFGPRANHGISFVSGRKQVDLMGCAAAEYDEAERFVTFVHEHKGGTPTDPQKRNRPPEVFADLQSLFDLKDKGVLTEDEFKSKKQELLEKIT